MNTLPTNLYTSTAAFTQARPQNRWSPVGAISAKLEEWESKREYARKVFEFIQTLPDNEEEYWAMFKMPSTKTTLIADHKANYSKAVSDVINLQRYLDLLRDDLDTHARHGKPILSADQYVSEYYHGLMPLAERVLFDDHYRVQWSQVNHLEAVGFIVYWDRNSNRLVIRWNSYELTV